MANKITYRRSTKMSDTWKDIQEEKNRKNSLQERRERRKKLMADIAQSAAQPEVKQDAAPKSVSTSAITSTSAVPSSSVTSRINNGKNGQQSAKNGSSDAQKAGAEKTASVPQKEESEESTTAKLSPEQCSKVEHELQYVLSDMTMNFPIDATQLMSMVLRRINNQNLIPVNVFDNLLHKLSAQQLLSLSTKEEAVKGESVLIIESADTSKLAALGGREDNATSTRKRKKESTENIEQVNKYKKTETSSESVESLLSAHTAKERVNKEMNEEILQLLSKPSAKEQSLVEKFRSHGGASVQEFCQFGTENECMRSNSQSTPCVKLHFRKIINEHTDESLGDCSFLNTCFHMETCKYVHYEINSRKPAAKSADGSELAAKMSQDSTILMPPQWIQCDVRKLDMSILGKFAVIMADPPWDIHMELPYGTMGDDEMRALDVPKLQDDGYIFLWVTGRAMELGRECLSLWGYERVDELIWVKTNQLQRIIRTGRTGHWLNHGKEHCLVGVKGEPSNMNRGLDCDVIVAEVRATSHKPDEIYGIIERLSPGSRKIELFGRPHNVQPNWVTLGNQLDGVRLLDPDVVTMFKQRYPDGSCLS